jgi:hypothetical protein
MYENDVPNCVRHLVWHAGRRIVMRGQEALSRNLSGLGRGNNASR